MRGIEQVEHAAGERQHGKSANAARTLGVGAGEKILECQAEKQAQAENKATLVTEGAEIMRLTVGVDRDRAVAT